MEPVQKKDDDRLDTVIGVLVAFGMLIGVGLYAIKPWPSAMPGAKPTAVVDGPVDADGPGPVAVLRSEARKDLEVPAVEVEASAPALVLSTAGVHVHAVPAASAVLAALVSAGKAPESAPVGTPSVAAASAPAEGIPAPDTASPRALVPKVVVVREHINFASDSAVLPSYAKPRLDKIAELLKSDPRTFTIAGHTDNLGDAQLNLNLSLARAEAVKAYLVEQGVPADKLKAMGMGEDDPLSTNATAKGRARNRRIEITE